MFGTIARTESVRWLCRRRARSDADILLPAAELDGVALQALPGMRYAAERTSFASIVQFFRSPLVSVSPTSADLPLPLPIGPWWPDSGVLSVEASIR